MRAAVDLGPSGRATDLPLQLALFVIEMPWVAFLRQVRLGDPTGLENLLAVQNQPFECPHRIRFQEEQDSSVCRPL